MLRSGWSISLETCKDSDLQGDGREEVMEDVLAGTRMMMVMEGIEADVVGVAGRESRRRSRTFRKRVRQRRWRYVLTLHADKTRTMLIESTDHPVADTVTECSTRSRSGPRTRLIQLHSLNSPSIPPPQCASTVHISCIFVFYPPHQR